MHVGVEHGEQAVDALDADAAHSLRDGVGAQQQQGAGLVERQRLADAGGVGVDDEALEARLVLGGDADVHEATEAGVDAVDGGGVRGEEVLVHVRAGLVRDAPRLVAQHDLGERAVGEPAGDEGDLRDGQREAVDLEERRRGGRVVDGRGPARLGQFGHVWEPLS
jgi:hypothetical protein